VSYGVVYNVAAPIEMYDRVHAEVTKHPADGLVMHVGREMDGGFQVVEIWESKEHLDRFNVEVMGPVIGKLTAGQPPPDIVVEEFDVRGLRVPAAGIH
jgi:hypothetical protein